MKISSIVARTCFVFELKMRLKLPFNATMSFSLLSLRKRFDHPRSRFCLVTQRSVAWRDKKGCEEDYHLAGCSGKQNGKILSKFSPSGFPLRSLNSIIPKILPRFNLISMNHYFRHPVNVFNPESRPHFASRSRILPFNKANPDLRIPVWDPCPFNAFSSNSLA